MEQNKPLRILGKFQGIGPNSRPAKFLRPVQNLRQVEHIRSKVKIFMDKGRQLFRRRFIFGMREKNNNQPRCLCDVFAVKDLHQIPVALLFFDKK